MLRRFSLYGFLKNQQYYEPFLILAFRHAGLSFFMIGVLIGFRELCINLFEIPSGAMADLYGRRRAMIFSFLSYIAAFMVFALADHVAWFFLAMLCFAIGEAFRTGTHKAMIFDWLAHQGRAHEKTRVYGYTRSWSQIGSAVSVLIAAGIVLATESYAWVFWASCLPYVLGIANFLSYPAYLDGEVSKAISIKAVFRHALATLRSCIAHAKLRMLLTESMFLGGCCATVKDYFQPLLKHTAIALPVLIFLNPERRTAVLVGAAYFLLYLLTAASSRLADRLSRANGGETATCRRIIIATGILFVVLIPILWYERTAVAIMVFIALAMLQNMWRPMFLSRMDHHADRNLGATVLSVDSQAKSVFTTIAAPLLGFAVDHAGFWCVGAFGAIAVAVLLLNSRRQT